MFFANGMQMIDYGSVKIQMVISVEIIHIVNQPVLMMDGTVHGSSTGNEAYANTSGNTHYTDGTVPEEAIGTTVRYGVISNSEFDLKKGKFVTEDGVSLLMAMSSGSWIRRYPIQLGQHRLWTICLESTKRRRWLRWQQHQ